VNGERSTVNGKNLSAWLALLSVVGPQAGVARYTAVQLNCATYIEEVRTEIRSKAGSVSREERAGRDGVVQFRATETDSGLEVTAWYDSLSVWREGPEGRIAPDAEGLLGGRWRGTLDRSGRYVGRDVPFIPDEVAEIAELRGLLADFFPLLPDSALAPRARHQWTRNSAADSTTVVQDSIGVPVRRETEESGSLEWDPRLGPVRWERLLTVTARIPPGKPFVRGVVTVVVQRVSVVRTDRNCVTGQR
jgi:hypothetical protein